MATASAGWDFAGWSLQPGSVSVLSDPTQWATLLTVNDNFTLTASFTPMTPLELALQIPEHLLGTLSTTTSQVNPSDLTILNGRLNGLSVAPYTDADCDLTGDGFVTAADRVLLRRILNGSAAPRQQ